MKRADYQRYLASREWAILKQAVRSRSGGICERCKTNPHDQTHHLTYERIGQELLEDLLAVCEPCHEYLSGLTPQDPIATTAAICPDCHGRPGSRPLYFVIGTADQPPVRETKGLCAFLVMQPAWSLHGPDHMLAFASMQAVGVLEYTLNICQQIENSKYLLIPIVGVSRWAFAEWFWGSCPTSSGLDLPHDLDRPGGLDRPEGQ